MPLLYATTTAPKKSADEVAGFLSVFQDARVTLDAAAQLAGVVEEVKRGHEYVPPSADDLAWFHERFGQLFSGVVTRSKVVQVEVKPQSWWHRVLMFLRIKPRTIPELHEWNEVIDARAKAVCDAAHYCLWCATELARGRPLE